jgi:2-polyprenyl-3-methyl-5-hydroxy-6-metoxy-1,4-benzoquinol methylase
VFGNAATNAKQDPEWMSDPFGKLRRKWRTLPLEVHGERVESAQLLHLPIDKLNHVWELARAKDDPLEIRGWYRLLYRDFVRGKQILDVGSGLAFDSITFAERGARVTCVDIVESNLEVVQRVARAKGVGDRVRTHYMHEVADLESLSNDFDVVMAIGSLHNAPRDVLKPEIDEIVRHLAIDGRWLQLVYPRARWEREGSLPFDEWAEHVDGPGTPWEEWYDVPKLLELLAPAQFELLFYTEWHNQDFNWFDLVRRG